jgi:hypothetical protein
MTDHDWIATAKDSFTGYYGMPPGLATAAATALLAREKAAGRMESDPAQVVLAHMDSDEDAIVDPDGDYGDEEPSITVGMGFAG